MRKRLDPSREAARLLPIALALLLALSGCRGKSAAPGAPDTPAAPAASASLDYPIHPVPFTHVKLEDAFWAPRLETNRTVSVPYALRMNEETGRVDNFRKAASLMAGTYRGKRYNDSDIYKSMEAAAYTLRLHPDPALDKTLDDLIAVIAKAQEPDGYLYHDPDRPTPPIRPPERARALVEPPRQPRALQRRPHVRGGRGPLPGHRQADVPGHRREERRASPPHLRRRTRPAPRLPRPPGDRDRPGQALPGDRQARLSRPGQVLPRRARPLLRRREVRPGRSLRRLRLRRILAEP